VLRVDRARAATLGVSQQQVSHTVAAGISGLTPAYLHRGAEEDPIGIHIGLSDADHAGLDATLALPLRSTRGTVIPVSEVIHADIVPWDGARFHKDLLPVDYVTGDMAGRLDSPLYGMFRIGSQLSSTPPAGIAVKQAYVEPPQRLTDATVRWDGEWTITYETFRDMGLAYSVGLILIYLLVVAQFGSYGVPLIIMAPIPLTIIGVMPGHALLGAQFTATSMIGMIALAGIIVRNSILLVDFINQEVSTGRPLAEAVVRAAAIRTKPILLTGIAAMTGAFFIIDDPIFNGLAISLIFGILVSTALTLVLIPVLYFGYLQRLATRQAEQH
jgi:multidrug efflux pump subunit AcrB